MKISELKQPYRRMAEYLEDNAKIQQTRYGIYNFYKQGGVMDLFCNSVDKGNHPEITEEIKSNFPPDFVFSGEKEELSFGFAYKDSDLSDEFKESFDAMSAYARDNFYKEKKIVEDKERYTQLAKEGKFDQLPATCEFSEAVELEVWDLEGKLKITKNVIGKFKGKFISGRTSYSLLIWNYAQLPTKKIDFTQFKTGDVVEVELVHNEKRIGWFDYVDTNNVVINVLKRKGKQVCTGGSCAGSKMLNKEKIKSITKIK